MSLRFIIDGCNIIHNPIFSRKRSASPQDKRLLLLEYINDNGLTGSPKNMVVVVFDGFPSKDMVADMLKERRQINIIFSGKGSADEKIRDILESGANNRNTVVVSDDKEIKFLVRSHLGRWMSVEDFLSRPARTGRAPDKLAREGDAEALSYSQKQAINQELIRLWLKP